MWYRREKGQQLDSVLELSRGMKAGNMASDAGI